MRHLEKIFAATLVLLIFGNSQGAPRTVFLDLALKDAMYIDYVQVVNYTDSTIVFTELKGYDGYNSIEWFDSENFRLKAKYDTTLFSARFKFDEELLNQFEFEKFTTSYIPEINEKVLIIINKKNYVSLFANLVDSTFRFWSPFYTGSDAMFCFNKPARKLTNGRGLSEKIRHYETCWSGCLLPAKDLWTYPRKNQIVTLNGKAEMSDGRALFIWEFANSEPYFLNGIDVWDKEYLNKTITVKGILVQFVEGKSMILNWEIIKIK